MLGMNSLNFLAYDFQGRLAASNHITVTSTAVGGGLDSDLDVMPDAWESAHGLDQFFDDAVLDYDADGLSNRQEYLTGTDPLDPRSGLRIEATRSDTGVRLNFLAVAGRSYTLQSGTALPGGPWTKLIDFAPQSTTRVVQLTDPLLLDSGERFYRLTTPQR
jgi:hypothetical protein